MEYLGMQAVTIEMCKSVDPTSRTRAAGSNLKLNPMNRTNDFILYHLSLFSSESSS